MWGCVASGGSFELAPLAVGHGKMVVTGPVVVSNEVALLRYRT